MSAPVQIGDFQIERQLGAGGMGIVYLARQVSLNRLVALKVLGNRINSPVDKSRFQREAHAVAKLSHPNIASVYFIGQDNNFCYLAMEYIDGVSLREVIERFAFTTHPSSSIDNFLSSVENEESEELERLDQLDEMADVKTVEFDATRTDLDPNPYRSPEAKQSISEIRHIRRCCEIVRDIALALDHAHSRGVVHRDIKPDNLMLNRDGIPQLIDFGVAKLFQDAGMTHTGALIGTPIYMSPEQVTGRITLDHRTDIYSLGLVLYELLTLERPIAAFSRDQVFQQIVAKPLIPVDWRNKSIPEPVSNIVHKATAKDRDERYATAIDFANDLKRFSKGENILAGRYNFKEDYSEIKRTRPARITFVAGVSFFAAVQTGSLILWSMVFEITRTDGKAQVMPVYFTIGMLLSLAHIYIGTGLLAAKQLARFLAIGVFVTYSLFAVASFSRPIWQDVGERFPWLQFERLLTMTDPLVSIFVAPFCALILLTRNSSDWFAKARSIRSVLPSARTSNPGT